MTQSISSRVDAIRAWLKEQNFDAIIIPHEDEFLGEYLPAHNERLQWATGFTGSAGAAVIAQDKAAIFVDGRYTVQVTKQAPSEIFDYCHLIQQPVSEWLKENLDKQSVVALDSKLHSKRWFDSLIATLEGKLSVTEIESNPIDQLWTDRPEAELSEIMLMESNYVGRNSENKREEISGLLTAQNVDAAILTQLDSICWLLNIRGLDVSRLPVILASAIIYSDSSMTLFLDPTRLPAEFQNHVGAGINVKHPDSLISEIQSLSGKTVLIDPNNSNAWFSRQLENADALIIHSDDPCLLPKAQKNATEAKGMKASHIRDGVAMAKFLSWLDSEVSSNKLHDEAELAEKLESFRREDPSLVDLSFDTISAASVNAAMCHYNHINQPSPTQLSMGSMYLVDSGGQYPDGTTDITRTIAIGTPTQEMKNQFTLVLKGHISLANAKFPTGTTGHQLDVLARQHLWANGFDFDHGTGHGVGHFLNVHEGPQRIAKVANSVALLPGMVLSNEPGYYREEEFGIRIENLEIVVEVETHGDFNVLGFESLTRCPIDKRCIEVSLLTPLEINWLDEYHQKVWNDLSALVESDVYNWLKQATSPIAR
ncbi:aminopeptidase P family protein [Vibrio sp. JC009]|uniref:aminopeptidase P family protein n=1 Tax=Vibrio sp. JC009 TaxID=2912314 RepID=UPI0023AF6B95|nr:aminopeptidase P family protein [Vibrio sp. JC009]WED21800.1 aminopeptidase P family protein [Vibrio sp. JC009]